LDSTNPCLMDAAAQSIDKEQPLVSIIMSVYNGEAFLQQAIDSILNQTYSHLQFIIIDDNSNQATKAILLAIQDKRVETIYNTQQLGLTKNLNTAINHCKGQYIARMDADDISLPNRIEKQVAFLEHNNHLAGTAGWIEMIDEHGNSTGFWSDDRNYTTEKEIAAILPKKNVIAHPTVMLYANVLQQYQYQYNEQQLHSQDWDLWLRLFANGLLIAKVKEVVLHYRVHSASITSTQKKKSVFKKIDKMYSNYLQQVSNWNEFNRSIKSNWRKNRLKLIASNIKRLFVK
jgi:glycosyltransferase involved in cell wall biosynthesis